MIYIKLHDYREELSKIVIGATKNAADLTCTFVSNTPTITTQETHTEVLVGSRDAIVFWGHLSEQRSRK
jgi:hypothetical protein